MSNVSDLTLAFINKRPETAARVLSTLPTDDAAAFTGSIPTRFAVRLLSLVNAKTVAAIVASMESTAAAAVIRDMEYLVAAAVLRQIQMEDRSALLDGLPRRKKRFFESSLAFAADTVGANMSMDIDAIPSSGLVADALRLKKAHAGEDSELTFVVDNKRTLIGVVSLLALLKHSETTPLLELAERNFVSVSPHMRLPKIAVLDAWSKFSQLPVVTRRGELIGAIHRRSVLLASSMSRVETRFVAETISGETLEMMGEGALGLIKLLSEKSGEHVAR